MLYASLISTESTADRRRSALRTRVLGASVTLAAAISSACSGGSGADVRAELRARRTTGRQRTTTARRPRRRTSSSSRSTSGTTFKRTTAAARATATRAVKRRCSRAATTSTWRMPPPTASSRCRRPPTRRWLSKVGGGHNCWLASNAACGDILTTWITNWAGSTASHGGAQNRARAADAARPRPEQEFPRRPRRAVLDDGLSAARAALLRVPLVELGAASSSPFFAEGPPSDSDAVELAYEAAKSKINLDDPAISRFVLRLRNEFHNCWTASCTNDANAMQTAIQQLQQRRNADVRRSEPCSRAKRSTLYEGTIASGGNRYEANVDRAVRVQDGPGLRHVDHRRMRRSRTTRAASILRWISRCRATCNGSAAGG